MTMAKTAHKLDALSYAQLEEKMSFILQKLQDSDVSLDEQVSLGEQGQGLLKEMQKRLDALKEKVEKISSSDTKGSLQDE